MTERFFDYHAPPKRMFSVIALVLIGQFRFAELLDHRRKKLVGDCEIEYRVAGCAMGLLGLVQRGAKLLVHSRLTKVAADVRHFLGKPVPRDLIDVVDIEPRRGVADVTLQHIMQARLANSASLLPFALHRSGQSSPATPWYERGCRAPA